VKQAREQIPAGEVFTARLAWSLVEMETARNFEALIDMRLALLKEEIMQIYRDRRPAPFFLDKG